MSTGNGFNPIINAFAAIGFTSILAASLAYINREAIAAWYQDLPVAIVAVKCPGAKK